MAPARKLTITIPEKLAERLDLWRDEMNISKICAEAIETRVLVFEAGHERWPRSMEPTPFQKAYTQMVFDVVGQHDHERQLGYDDGAYYAEQHTPDEAYYEQVVERVKSHRLPEPAERELAKLREVAEVLHDGMRYRLAWLKAAGEVWGEL